MGARHDMALAMRNEGQIAWLQRATGSSFHFEEAFSGRYNMEHQRIFNLRNSKRPRRFELRATIESATHTKEMEGFADRVLNNWQFNLHNGEYAPAGPNVQ